MAELDAEAEIVGLPFHVKFVNGELAAEILCTCGDTLRKLKERIFEVTGVPIARQILLLGSKHLAGDAQTLGDVCSFSEQTEGAAPFELTLAQSAATLLRECSPNAKLSLAGDELTLCEVGERSNQWVSAWSEPLKQGAHAFAMELGVLGSSQDNDTDYFLGVALKSHMPTVEGPADISGSHNLAPVQHLARICCSQYSRYGGQIRVRVPSNNCLNYISDECPGVGFEAGDEIALYADLDNSRVQFARNGAWYDPVPLITEGEEVVIVVSMCCRNWGRSLRLIDPPVPPLEFNPRWLNAFDDSPDIS